MTCGVCLEVCPNVTENNKFVGAQAISQVRLFNLHPTGSMTKDERLNALMGTGGLQQCGNSQNCVNACPKRYSINNIHCSNEQRNNIPHV